MVATSIGTTGLVKKAPLGQANAKVVTWLENFEIGSELLDSLERVIFNEKQDVNDYHPIIEE